MHIGAFTAAFASVSILAAAASPTTIPDSGGESSTLKHAPSIGALAALTPTTPGTYSLSGHDVEIGDQISVTTQGADGSELTIQYGASLDSEYEVLDSQTLVTDGSDGASQAYVQAAEDGAARIITTIPTSSSSHTFEYSVGDEFSVQESEDGGLYIYADGQASDQVSMFKVEKPWAKDSSGTDVPTHYEIEGSTFTQVVAPQPTTEYPITADPTWEWHDAAYGVGFNKAETRDAADKASDYAAFCAVLAGTGVGAALCAAAVAGYSNGAKQARDRGGCVFFATAPAPVALNYDKSAHCV